MSTRPAAQRAPRDRGARGAAALLCMLALWGTSTVACLFQPDLAAAGYTSCTSDDDCAAGRLCSDALCAPPPWHDEEFDDRRLLTVTNRDIAPLPAGTAIPVPIGGEGAPLALADVGVDLRFTDFAPATRTWQVTAVHLDRQDDRFTAWIPLPRAVLPGRTGVLAWVESDTEAALPTVLEDPLRTFAVFDDFSAPALDETLWRALPPDNGPEVLEGRARVSDNQALILTPPLVPPTRVDVIARVNGTTCEEIFIGLIGDDRSLFTVPPTAGLALENAREGNVLVAPTPGSVPTPVAAAALAATADSRYAFMVDGAGVRVSVDGTVLYEELDLQPSFGAEPLYLAMRVGGACSLEAAAVWVTPAPLPTPTLEVGPLVERRVFN